jgi:hypothetical protein
VYLGHLGVGSEPGSAGVGSEPEFSGGGKLGVVVGGGGGPVVVAGGGVQNVGTVGTGRQSASSWHGGRVADALSCVVSEIAAAAMPVPIATVIRPMVLMLDIGGYIRNICSLTRTGVGEGSGLSVAPSMRDTHRPHEVKPTKPAYRRRDAFRIGRRLRASPRMLGNTNILGLLAGCCSSRIIGLLTGQRMAGGRRDARVADYPSFPCNHAGVLR